MYEAILHDVYKQWLEEFDHKAAFKRNLPRREREWRFRSRLAALRGRAHGREAGAAPLHRVADAQQCAR
jgi:hypothetical protein